MLVEGDARLAQSLIERALRPLFRGARPRFTLLLFPVLKIAPVSRITISLRLTPVSPRSL